MGETQFDEHLKKFSDQGIKFGPAPSVFQIISVGEVNRSTYTLTAYVVLPAVPEKRKLPETDEDGEIIPPAKPSTGTDEDEDEDEDGEGSGETDESKQKTQLLEPRIVEIFIN